MSWLIATAGASALLAGSQSRARQAVEERFAIRASIASRFVTTYVGDLVAGQKTQARRHLAARRVSATGFRRTMRDNGYSAAVLLDQHGHVMQVHPAKPALLGRDITGKYPHLRRALQGGVAVSKVVPSAARGIPVVAFASPFASVDGRRVFSGAYDVASTPVGAYLRNAIPIRHSALYVLDPSGTVIARNGEQPRAPQRLTVVDPALAASLEHRSEGSSGAGDGQRRYVSSSIAGTPWRVVVAAPSKLLYDAVRGANTWLAWLALAGLAVVSLLALVLSHRYVEGRARLAVLYQELERAVCTDALTGLCNRRQLESEHLARAASAARRHGLPLAVLLIDIDHFKRINDGYGHQAGDEALAQTAAVMRSQMRQEDLLGRWGGEEFLALVTGATTDEAAVAAERIRAAVAAHEVRLHDGTLLRLTISIGVAAATREVPEETIRRADAALYAAKAAGRDRISLAPSPPVESPKRGATDTKPWIAAGHGAIRSGDQTLPHDLRDG